MRRWAGAAVMVMLATVMLAMPVAAVAADSTAPPYDHEPTAEPPMIGGKPVVVSVSLHVINLSKIDDSAQHFDIDGYLFTRWNDPRLAFVSKGPGDLVRSYQPGEIWSPRLEIVNATAPRERHDTSISGAPDGDVTYVERFNAELSARFELKRYPFDIQTLEIFIHPFLPDANQIVFTLSHAEVWAASEFTTYSSLAQWDLQVLPPVLHTHPEISGVLNGVRFGMRVTRRSTYYIWKVFVPLALMVCVSCCRIERTSRW